MKMRKIMAAAVAATMAVTSLAAVASAETLTFSMKKTEGKFAGAGSKGWTYGMTVLEPGTDSDLSILQVKATDMIADNYGGGKTVLDATELTTGKPKLTVKGLKMVGTAAIEATATYEYTEANVVTAKLGSITAAEYEAFVAGGVDTEFFKKNADDTTTKCYLLYVYGTEGPAGSLIAAEWAEVREMSIATPELSAITIDGDVYAKEYANAWDIAFRDKNWADLYAEGTTAAGKFSGAIKTVITGFNSFGASTRAMTDKYALLNRTTANDNDTIYRNDVKLLSDTSHYVSNTDDVIGDGAGQTYDDNGMGTLPYRFAGLASQVADFFNHKTNGAITMKFALGASTDSGWANGGIPSTEVGLRADLEANNFALFVNYSSSTGSLQAVTSVDKNAGTVTFDISEILADLGGQTKGVVTDIFYGLNQGIYYGDPYKATGLLVEEVTLSYEDDAAEEDIVEEEVVEEEEVTEEEVEEEVTEEEEEVELEEEEEEPAEEEEEEVDGEMFEEEETEEEDVNPGTGVALAVVPAMIAAAAAVVSKKRK